MIHTYSFRNTFFKFIIAVLFGFSSSFAQTVDNHFEKQKQDQLSRLDLKGLGKRLLLSNGVISLSELESFQSLSRADHFSSSETITAGAWQNLYERLLETDLRPTNDRLPALSRLTETDPNKATKNNIVPIGIMERKASTAKSGGLSGMCMHGKTVVKMSAIHF